MYTRITDSDNRFGEFAIMYNEKRENYDISFEEFRIVFFSEKAKQIIYEFLHDKRNYSNSRHYPETTEKTDFTALVVFSFNEKKTRSHMYLYNENGFMIYHQIDNRPLAEKMLIPEKYLSTYILWKEDVI